MVKNKARPRKLVHFLPNSLLFLVTHDVPGRWLSGNERQQLFEWGAEGLRSQFRSSAPRLEPAFDDLTFPSTKNKTQGPFSVIVANVEGLRDTSSRRWLDGIGHLNERRADWRADGHGLELISPNWLAGAESNDGIGTGGPGGEPVPYMDSDAAHAHLAFRLQSRAVLPKNGGRGVEIAILDTAPSEDKVQQYLKWRNQDLTSRSHSLLNGLLDGNQAKLSIKRGFYDSRLHDTTILKHDYDMSDHGLFVAGIIHSIAPEAELRLFEVLNRFGVGDTASILRKLYELIMNQDGERPRIVNCSFVVDIPLAFRHCRDMAKAGIQVDEDLEATLKQHTRSPNWKKTQGKPLEWACNLLYEGTGIFAASGNDAQGLPHSSRPVARHPADFDSVQGVGALNRYQASIPAPAKNRRAASYSNRSDKPEIIGIATLGGEEGEREGVLGLYIGEFPNGQPNTTNLAWWSGTSFATPIMSGVTADVLSGMSTSANADAAIRLMRNAGAFVRKATVTWEEDVLPITQS